MKKFDVAVIGGGPGGYVAAIRAAKLGCSVALIEGDQLGGACLNRGCIPSKTLLRHAEVIEQIEQAKNWGIETGELRLSFEKMMDRKNQVIKNLQMGIKSLLKAGKIEHYQGWGTVSSKKAVVVQKGDHRDEIQAKKVILATGSSPFIPSFPGIKHVQTHTSDTIFDLTQLPKSIAIIGAGIIGVEFACIFSSLNVQVTMIEMADCIIPSESKDVSTILHRELKKKGVNILTSTKVKGLEQRDNTKSIIIETKDRVIESCDAEEILVAVGRRPNLSAIEGLPLEMNGPFVKVNQQMETSIPGIYAVGDMIGGWQLAHVASAEGIIAAENTVNLERKVDYRVVPRCVYTSPEIASVGLSEIEAKEQGYSVKSETYQFRGNGKALATDEKEGFVKIIADEKYGEILGVLMIGPHVTEMISEASAFIHLEGTVEELANMIHPHPSLSESLFEAAASWLGKGIHK